MIEQLLPNDIFSLLLVFSRIGAAVMVLPGFGEAFVNPRIRLFFAIGLTVVVTPVVADTLMVMPDSLIGVFLAVVSEIFIGLFIGGISRVLVSSLHIAGVIIGFQSSLGNASLFDPASAQQGSLLGAFFNIVGVFLIFAADLHHLMLLGLADSYAVFVPGAPLPIGEFSDLTARVLAKSFTLGLQIAAPFVVVGLVFYIGLGLLARLMPQVQIFFIAIPLQMMLAFLLMTLTLSAGMMWFLGNFENTLAGLFGNF